MYADSILSQCDSFRSEPILNPRGMGVLNAGQGVISKHLERIVTKLTGCFDQNLPFVDCLHFGLVQDWFSICPYPYLPIHADFHSPEPQLNQ